MACSASKQKQHALAIPVPAQGHITALMRFCTKLASQQDFTITFVDILLSEQEHTSINACIPTQDQASPAQAAHEKLDIRRVSIQIPSLEEAVAPDQRMSVPETFYKRLEISSPLFEELLSRLLHEDPPITCLISDLYITCPTQKVADKFGIPRVAFHAGNQSVLVFENSILDRTISLDQVLKVVTSKDVSKEDTFVEGVPGLPTLRNGDLMDFLDDNVFYYKLSLQILKDSKERALAIVVNTFEELEELGLKVNIGDIPVYALGPSIEPLEKDTSTSLWKEDHECLLWLEKQPCLSVLYISFGSFATLSKAQFEEFVAGLIASEQRFLWVVRSDLVVDTPISTLQTQLLSQSRGKGYLIEWAPQTRVLSHPSVGGFLTHCGWNSTIEALTLGVPMLCFPYMADQFINAKLITQEWKVGLGFNMCKEGGLAKSHEVERVIRALMVGEQGKVFWRNAEYLQKIIHQNLHLEKACSKDIQALVDSLQTRRFHSCDHTLSHSFQL